MHSVFHKYLAFLLRAAAFYVTGLPRVLYFMTIGVFLTPLRTYDFWIWVSHWVEAKQTNPVLRSLPLADIFTLEGDVVFQGPFYQLAPNAAYPFMDFITLATVSKFVRPRRIFEFGTYVGRSAKVLLQNADSASELITVDLPQGQNLDGIHVGRDVKTGPEASRITFLTGNSKTLDLSKWYGTCQLVYIDADHSYEAVKSDTEKAFLLASPEGSWLLWDDYHFNEPWVCGVTRYLHELKRIQPGLTHVTGTNMVVLHILPTNKL
jgi:hypothetical protein